MNKNKQQGFIALFLILSMSMTFIFYIYLSSERVFDYIHIKDEFIKNRNTIYNISTCADIFVNNLIKSDFNLYFVDNKYSFKRSFDFYDDYICYVDNINVLYEEDSISQIKFKIDNIALKYTFKNGFINLKKPWELFE